jgi:hypothetical protein
MVASAGEGVEGEANRRSSVAAVGMGACPAVARGEWPMGHLGRRRGVSAAESIAEAPRSRGSGRISRRVSSLRFASVAFVSSAGMFPGMCTMQSMPARSSSSCDVSQGSAFGSIPGAGASRRSRPPCSPLPFWPTPGSGTPSTGPQVFPRSGPSVSAMPTYRIRITCRRTWIWSFGPAACTMLRGSPFR